MSHGRRPLRRAALPLGVLVPRRCVASRGARRPGGGARLRGARAHRPRRRLRLARVRARGEVVGLRPITGAEVTLEGGCARHSARARSRGLRESLPHPHGGARRDTPRREEDRELLPPAVAARDRRRAERGARLPLGLRAGGARRSATRTRPRGSRRRSAASDSSSSCSGRSSAATRGGTRRCAISPSTSASRRSRRGTSTPTAARGRCSRTCSSRSAAAPRSTGCERERRGNRESVLRPPAEMVERFAGIDRAAAERTGCLAERLEFDLTEELGYRYPDFSDGPDPAIRRLAEVCAHAFGERYDARDAVASEARAHAWRASWR